MATQLGEDRDDRAPGAIRPLQSRLRPPGAHVELVVREALVERLRRTEAPLILVSAPAGYGKTTALAQWAGTDGRPALQLRLAAAPVDGAANKALIALLAEALALRKVDIAIRSGATSRLKILTLAGDSAAIIARLNAWTGRTP